MQKILTPTQYEPALDRLNVLRPLQVKERVRSTLNIPLLNQLPVESKKSVTGRLVKCTQQGGTIIRPPQGFTQSQVFYFGFEEGVESASETFGQTVYGLFLRVYDVNGVWGLLLSDSTYVITYWSTDVVGCYYIPFVGKTFYLYWVSGAGAYAFVDAYGFY